MAERLNENVNSLTSGGATREAESLTDEISFEPVFQSFVFFIVLSNKTKTSVQRRELVQILC